MTLRELSDLLDTNIVLTRYSNQGNRWSADLDRTEVKDGCCLVGEYGMPILQNRRHWTTLTRLEKTLICNAMSKNFAVNLQYQSQSIGRAVSDLHEYNAWLAFNRYERHDTGERYVSWDDWQYSRGLFPKRSHAEPRRSGSEEKRSSMHTHTHPRRISG